MPSWNFERDLFNLAEVLQALLTVLTTQGPCQSKMFTHTVLPMGGGVRTGTVAEMLVPFEC